MLVSPGLISTCPRCNSLVSRSVLASTVVLSTWSDQGSSPNIASSMSRCPKCGYVGHSSRFLELGLLQPPTEIWTVRVRVLPTTRLRVIRRLKDALALPLQEARHQVEHGPILEGMAHELGPVLEKLDQASIEWTIESKVRAEAGSPEAWFEAPPANWVDCPQEMFNVLESNQEHDKELELSMRIEAFQQDNLPWRNLETQWIRPSERGGPQARNLTVMMQLLAEHQSKPPELLLLEVELHRQLAAFSIASRLLQHFVQVNQHGPGIPAQYAARVAEGDERLFELQG